MMKNDHRVEEMRENIILIDLPTYPKGVVSLSLLHVAAALQPWLHVKIIDLNIYPEDHIYHSSKPPMMYGLKVSSQNFHLAIQLSEKLKHHSPSIPIVWGGEFATLQPDLCAEYADCVVSGLFDSIAEAFAEDLIHNRLQSRYIGKNEPITFGLMPDFALLGDLGRYHQFMGLPMETSRGCTEHCLFCMVHTMQKKHYHIKPYSHIAQMLPNYRGQFINIIDYNFGVDRAHVMAVARLIESSEVLGWMAEMCIELLDDDEMLAVMAQSRCRMIYCGLEALETDALQSINKDRTNRVEEYRRIIKKVQSYGIHIAAGIILGLEGSHQQSLHKIFNFYQETGIIYAKLTFLTYNPGTRVQKYMEKKGHYLRSEPQDFDGNRLTFLPHGVSEDVVLEGTTWFIDHYYSFAGILRRSLWANRGWLDWMEFVCFNLCYRDVYLQWVRRKTLQHPDRLQELIEPPFRPGFWLRFTDKVLHRIRQWRWHKAMKAGLKTRYNKPSETTVLRRCDDTSITEPS